MYFIVESENKINAVLFKPKTTQALPKIELIPQKVEKYNLTKDKKSPLKEKLQPVDVADWTDLAKMPTYKQPETVLQSDWWKAAAFLEMFVHWVFIKSDTKIFTLFGMKKKPHYYCVLFGCYIYQVSFVFFSVKRIDLKIYLIIYLCICIFNFFIAKIRKITNKI